MCDGVSLNCFACGGGGIITEDGRAAPWLLRGRQGAGEQSMQTHQETISPSKSLIPKSLTSKAPNPMTVCRFCAASVRVSKIERHIAERCPKATAVAKLTEKDKVKTPIAGIQSHSDGEEVLEVEMEHPYLKAALYQEFSDPYDDSKGWGHSFRDNGAFGSYPGHDGYGDESFS